MKTRIISGVVGALLFIASVVSGCLVSPIIIDICMIFVGAVAVYEVLWNTKVVKNKALVGISIFYSIVAPTLYSNYGIVDRISPLFLTVIFVVVVMTISMMNNKKTKPQEAMMTIAMTAWLTFSFWSLTKLFNTSVFCFMLVFVFAWISDTGAYFVGVFFGKHKMSPVISPKKTWEGFAGGIVFSFLGGLVACLIFDVFNSQLQANMISVLALSPFLSVAGVIGDLTASYIKRDCGIKDYGHIMPGHGGIMDRFDSVIMIAPLMVIMLEQISYIIPR